MELFVCHPVDSRGRSLLLSVQLLDVPAGVIQKFFGALRIWQKTRTSLRCSVIKLGSTHQPMTVSANEQLPLNSHSSKKINDVPTTGSCEGVPILVKVN